jgi:flavin-binding protein dodecin
VTISLLDPEDVACVLPPDEIMSEHVYKVIELVGSSTTCIEDAVQHAIGRASQTLKNLRWFEIVSTRGQIENGKPAYYQVMLSLLAHRRLASRRPAESRTQSKREGWGSLPRPSS